MSTDRLDRIVKGTSTNQLCVLFELINSHKEIGGMIFFFFPLSRQIVLLWEELQAQLLILV